MKVQLTHIETIYELDFKEQNFYIKLGLTIRTYRRSKNFSQEYMAAKLNISQNAYSKIEAGKCRCSVYRLINILDLLQLDTQAILPLDYCTW